MGLLARSAISRKPNDTMRLIVTTFVGVVLGFLIGVSFPSLTLTKLNLRSIDLQDKNSGLSTHTLLNAWSALKGNKNTSIEAKKPDGTKIWVPSNPRGAERLPPAIVAADSDFYLRRLWGLPSEVSLFFFTFICICLWYAKRFLHPDIVAAYDYIFIWDEDLGVEHFNAEEYIRLARKHGLEISQPGLEPTRGLVWQMTKRRGDREVHKETEEKPGWCKHPLMPPCAAFIEIMAPVFSRDAWRCVWHLIQNDLVHGWGLDFALQKCVEPAHEKIGVVDAQWIVHQTVPSLGNQVKVESIGQELQEVSLRCSCAHDFNNLFNFVVPLLARCGRGVEESGKCFRTGYRMQKKLTTNPWELTLRILRLDSGVGWMQSPPS
ncbi:hypothetical protein RHGRI_034298 [Rhododendron griersonianum]|uniref:Uncharacterized protein n=1 Tax=Rhododendron griersonianum TaxID=479676 RepID=A0AAV6I5U6_9ERIC|nr:hypothetical protein RHGRI_034298 [Rhododendron griersonianum]